MKCKKIFSAFAIASMVLSATSVYSHALENRGFNAKVVTVANTVSYLTVDAKSLDSNVSKLFLDGKEVKFSKVSDDGKIVKTEFDGKHKKAKVVLENGQSFEKDILGVYNRFPYKGTANPKAPDIVWGHVTIPVFDFHQVAKDDNGKEIKFPQKSSFSVTDEAKPIDAVSAPTLRASNEIDDLTSGKYAVTSDSDLKILLNKSIKNERNKYIRAVKVRVSDGRKTVKEMRLKKVLKGNEGELIIPKELLNSLQKNREYTFEIVYRGLKTESIKVTVKESHPEVNPNPVEKADSNVIDYGKDIEFRYNLNDKNQANEFKRLLKVNKVYSDKHEESLKLVKSVRGADGIATVKFASSRAIQQRGPQKIKLIFRGLKPQEKDFVFKDKAPEIELNSNSGDYIEGKSLLFTLNDFEYLFQQDTGVEAVYVNGEKLVRRYVPNDDENLQSLRDKGIDAIENESENGFHVVGNLLRIKNDGIKALHPGVNYITVKYKTYHDSNFKFVLEGKNKKSSQESSPAGTARYLKRAVNTPVTRTRRAALDVVSGATSGGVSKPSVGGSDSSGGTVNMGATLAYNFDMISNASIIEDLGYHNSSAKKLLDYWEGTAKEAVVYKNNPNRKVVWDSYMNYVQKNRLNNSSYKSFSDYYNDPSVVTTENAPYQIKYVIGNGLGAPIFNINELFEISGSEKAVPESVVKAFDHINVRDNIVLNLDNWTNNIENIKVNGSLLKEGKDYKVNKSDNELVISGKLFKKDGNYKLSIKTKGYEEFTKTMLVKSEKKTDTVIRLRTDDNFQNKVFTGEKIGFEIMDPEARVTGAILSINGKYVAELDNGKGYNYISSLGQLDIDKKFVKEPGEYMVRFYFAGRGFKDVKFDVVGEKLNYVKAPISKSQNIRLNGNKVSFRLENYTGNREISNWLDSISSVEVNSKAAVRNNEPGKRADKTNPLTYEIRRNPDASFDAASFIYVDSALDSLMGENGPVKVVIKGDGYANVEFDYDMKDMKPLENRDIHIRQADPETGKEVNNLYIKGEYLDKDDVSLVAPFDEESMNKLYPGMQVDKLKNEFSNDGSYKNFEDFIRKTTLVQINGERIHFGSTGMYLYDKGNRKSSSLAFFKHQFKPGDVVTIFSEGYPRMDFMVR